MRRDYYEEARIENSDKMRQMQNVFWPTGDDELELPFSGVL